MYKVKDRIYSDAGKVLIYKGCKSYSLPEIEGIVEIAEEDVDFSNARINRIFIDYGGLRRLNHKYDYGQWKAAIIKWRYSNDDQIAILLNKDDSAEDKMRYDKMQEWREYASVLAKKFVELNELS